MKVQVRLFGYVREAVGKGLIEVEVPGSPRLQDVVEKLGKMFPIRNGIRFAINTEYSDPQDEIKEGDVVSVIPPVQGG